MTNLYTFNDKAAAEQLSTGFDMMMLLMWLKILGFFSWGMHPGKNRDARGFTPQKPQI